MASDSAESASYNSYGSPVVPREWYLLERFQNFRSRLNVYDKYELSDYSGTEPAAQFDARFREIMIRTNLNNTIENCLDQDSMRTVQRQLSRLCGLLDGAVNVDILLDERAPQAPGAAADDYPNLRALVAVLGATDWSFDLVRVSDFRDLDETLFDFDSIGARQAAADVADVAQAFLRFVDRCAPTAMLPIPDPDVALLSDTVQNFIQYQEPWAAWPQVSRLQHGMSAQPCRCRLPHSICLPLSSPVVRRCQPPDETFMATPVGLLPAGQLSLVLSAPESQRWHAFRMLARPERRSPAAPKRKWTGPEVCAELRARGDTENPGSLHVGEDAENSLCILHPDTLANEPPAQQDPYLGESLARQFQDSLLSTRRLPKSPQFTPDDKVSLGSQLVAAVAGSLHSEQLVRGWDADGIYVLWQAGGELQVSAHLLCVVTTRKEDLEREIARATDAGTTPVDGGLIGSHIHIELAKLLFDIATGERLSQSRYMNAPAGSGPDEDSTEGPLLCAIEANAAQNLDSKSLGFFKAAKTCLVYSNRRRRVMRLLRRRLQSGRGGRDGRDGRDAERIANMFIGREIVKMLHGGSRKRPRSSAADRPERSKRARREAADTAGSRARSKTKPASDKFFAKCSEFDSALEAYAKTGGQTGVPRTIRVAILDTGVNRDYGRITDSLASGRITEEQCRNFTGGTGPGQDWRDAVNDESGHGSRVADLLLRVAPDVGLCIAKVTADGRIGPQEAQYIADAIEHATSKSPGWDADIVVLSLGIQDARTADMQPVKARIAALMRASHRTLFFAAAGNGAGYEPVRFPANQIVPNMFCVFASDHDGRPAPSNPRPNPGAAEAGGAAFMTLGVDIAFDPFPPAPDDARDNETQSGSSFAAPVLAGVAVQLLRFADAMAARGTPVDLGNGVAMRAMLRELAVGNAEPTFVAPWHSPFVDGWQERPEQIKVIEGAFIACTALCR